jgi:hypothetical protein
MGLGEEVGSSSEQLWSGNRIRRRCWLLAGEFALSFWLVARSILKDTVLLSWRVITKEEKGKEDALPLIQVRMSAGSMQARCAD